MRTQANVLLDEGRVVGPSWEKLKPKGPKGSSRSLTAIRKDAGLCCGSRLLEGRSVCLCWAPSKPTGPKGLSADPVYGRAKCLPVLGEIKT